jgi:hypothetical protein
MATERNLKLGSIKFKVGKILIQVTSSKERDDEYYDYYYNHYHYTFILVIYSFLILSYDKSIASSKASSPHSAI